MSATLLVERCLSMKDVISVGKHESSLQMQMSHNRDQELGKDTAAKGKAKGENFPLINNGLPCPFPDGKPKVLSMRWKDQHTHIGILESSDIIHQPGLKPRRIEERAFMRNLGTCRKVFKPLRLGLRHNPFLSPGSNGSKKPSNFHCPGIAGQSPQPSRGTPPLPKVHLAFPAAWVTPS